MMPSIRCWILLFLSFTIKNYCFAWMSSPTLAKQKKVSTVLSFPKQKYYHNHLCYFAPLTPQTKRTTHVLFSRSSPYEYNDDEDKEEYNGYNQPRRNDIRKPNYRYDDGDYYWEEKSVHERRRDNYKDTEGYYDYDMEDNDSLFQEEIGIESDNDTFDDYQLDWEDGNDNNVVLLPPPEVTKPSCIIHFVGGTFFGSTAKLWYRKLLQGIVQDTNCVIVATNIPVTVLSSPLNHIRLAQKIQQSFWNAYLDIVEDEYGYETLESVPICGMGHSLGARLLVVLETLQTHYNYYQYKSMILLSFFNHNAATGIPGLSALIQRAKSHERMKRVSREPVSQGSRSQQRQRRRRRGGRSDYDYEYGEMDQLEEEFTSLVQNMQSAIWKQAQRVQTAITPKSKDLELRPSPVQLWKAIEQDQRYDSINTTLIVQFDDDAIDQGSKLARILYSNELSYQSENENEETEKVNVSNNTGSAATTTTTTTTVANDTNSTSFTKPGRSSTVFMCRLRGTHLTPISVDLKAENSLGIFGGTTTKTIWESIQRLRGRDKQSLYEQEISLHELRQSISSFITDMVAK